MGFSSVEFGESVDVSGSVIVVGASLDLGVTNGTGAAHVYRYDGATWNFETTLIQTDGEANDGFARSVAVDGDVIICSAQGHRPGGVLLGAAYIYRYDAGAMTWGLEQKIVGPPFDPGLGLSSYGEPVALDAGVACVGAPHFTSSLTVGRVFVYRNSGSSWPQEDVLFGSDVATDTYFGTEIDVVGDVIAVGDMTSNFSRGAAYVFRKQGSWVEEAKLEIPDLDSFDFFGRKIAIGTDVVLVGAWRDDNVCIPGTETGSALVFGYDGSQWRLEDILCPSDVGPQDFFGSAVAIDGLQAIVGAKNADIASTGAAYAFQLDRDSDGDGLFDSWEINGIPIPGGPSVYVLPRADPQHKDLYVEIDAMDAAGLAPSMAILNDVVAVFAAAPTPNPDGNDGINLHVEFLESNVPTVPFPNHWTDFDPVKAAWFGSPTERADPNSVNILEAKRQAFRYCIFGQSHSGGS